MANVYLQGGPCNGKSVPDTEIQGGLVGYVVCKGADYINTDRRRRNGELIFAYSASGVPQPPGGISVGAGKSLKAWSDIRQQVNTGLPTMLRKVGKLNRATSQQLARRGRVRH